MPLNCAPARTSAQNAARLKPNRAARRHRYMLDKHIFPAFGRYKIAAMLPADIRGWLTAMKAAGVRPATARQIEYWRAASEHRGDNGRCPLGTTVLGRGSC